MDLEQLPIKTFDPMLRDLLHWDLVVQAEDPAGPRWQLSDSAVRRLDEIAAESPASVVEHMVYLDRACGVCGSRRLTRLRDGRFVCEACWLDVEAPADSRAQVATEGHEPHAWVTPWRQRTA